MIASVLGVLAVLLLVVSVVGVWAKATVLRGERVAELVRDAIDEPEVQAALAALLADEAQEAVDLEDRLASLLPSQLTRFAGPIAAGAHAAVERSLEAVLASPRTQEAITTLVERAHARALRLLRGRRHRRRRERRRRPGDAEPAAARRQRPHRAAIDRAPR